ncbi:hypothetical protein ABBQ32_006000 [Trebouxia sp. C0010 RCD-2024]
MPDIRQLFLASSKAPSEELPTAAPAKLPATSSCTDHLTRAVVDTSLHGRVSSKHEVSLTNLQWSSYRQVACHPQCLPEHPALQSDGPPPPALPMLLNFQQRFSHLLGLRRHCVVSTQLDSHGDLVLSASTSGKIALHDFAMLRESSSCAVLDEESQYRGLDPILLIASDRRLEKARWHPNNDNLFATVAASDRSVYLYDAQYTQGAPYQTLSVPAASWQGVGLTDMALPAKGSYNAIATAQNGHVYLWDQRGGSAPRTKLGMGSGFSMNSLQLSDDANMLLVGTQTGDVVGYDLRGGTSAAMALGSGGQHPAVLEVAVRQALMQLPELEQQTSIPRSSVQSINLNHKDCNRLAFHLASGWSGVLDLRSQAVTHVHCPPPADATQPVHQYGRSGGERQQPCWMPDGASFCVGEAAGTGLHIVDFHPSSHSPCHVGCTANQIGFAPAKDATSGWHAPTLPSAVTIPVTSAITSVTAHPDTDEIVAGTEAGRLLLLANGCS